MNVGCVDGDEWKLPAFIQVHRQELNEGYEKLDDAQLEAFKDNVNELCVEKKTMPRTNTKGIQKDVDHTFDVFKQEVSEAKHAGICIILTHKIISFMLLNSGPVAKDFTLPYEEMSNTIMNLRYTWVLRWRSFSRTP
jgi:hypothetical protein